MVDCRPAPFLLVPLEHREVRHPEEREQVFVDREPGSLPELNAERAQHARGHRPRVRRKQQSLSRRRGEGLDLPLGEKT